MKKAILNKFLTVKAFNIIKYIIIGIIGAFFIYRVATHNGRVTGQIEKHVEKSIKENLTQIENNLNETQKIIHEQHELTENTIELINANSFEERLEYLRGKGVIIEN